MKTLGIDRSSNTLAINETDHFLMRTCLLLSVFAIFLIAGATAKVIDVTPEMLLDIAHGENDDTWFIKLCVDSEIFNDCF